MFRYETHAHTAEVSRCGRIEARALARFYHELGFSGLCVTDHFFNGNTWIGRSEDWTGMVRRLGEGYRLAREEGEKLGLTVFFGWEYAYRGTDLLTYGLDEQWLLGQPDLLSLHINDYCDRVHASGGFIVHAHPFREADYIDMIRLLPRKVDAVETFNASRSSFENAQAEHYAGQYNLLSFSGSDNHQGQMAWYGGFEADRPLETIEQLVSAIRSGKALPFACPGQKHFSPRPTGALHHIKRLP